jgi:hypothetical protein
MYTFRGIISFRPAENILIFGRTNRKLPPVRLVTAQLYSGRWRLHTTLGNQLTALLDCCNCEMGWRTSLITTSEKSANVSTQIVYRLLVHMFGDFVGLVPTSVVDLSLSHTFHMCWCYQLDVGYLTFLVHEYVARNSHVDLFKVWNYLSFCFCFGVFDIVVYLFGAFHLLAYCSLLLVSMLFIPFV